MWHPRSLSDPTLPPALLNDLRDLMREFGIMGNRLSKLEVNDPLSTASTASSAAATVSEPYVLAVAGSADLTDERLLVAGSGLTSTDGGAGGNLTLNVGAGTGISVAADTVSIAAAYLGANPTVSVGLTAVNGTATSYLRSDGAPPLSQGIIPTWTGVHTFSAESVHNGGLDIGTSGRFDSNVADAAAATSFLFKPTVAQTSGTDRYIFRIQDSSANGAFTVNADNTVVFNGTFLSGSYLSVGGDLPTGAYLGINFFPISFVSSGAVGPFASAVCGGAFQLNVPATVASNASSGWFQVTDIQTTTRTDVWASTFRTTRTGNNTTTRLGCIYLTDSSAQAKGTVTDWIGLYGASIGTLPSTANKTWIYLTEITTGSGNLNEMFLAGGGEVFFRDQALHLGSLTDGHLDLTADVSIDMNGDMDISAKNIITDGTTGTKFGTATTQKIGFYNATPIVQPSAYTQTYSTADKTHANLTSATLTDSTGGTPGTTLAAITGGGTNCETAAKDAIASLAAQVNALRVDLEDVKQLANSVVDDLQALGLVA